MPESLLKFSTQIDLSGAQAGASGLADAITEQMAAATAIVDKASASISQSFASQAAAASSATSAIADAYASIQSSAGEAAGGANAAAAASADAADLTAAAYKQIAAATLELATARKQVADSQASYLAGELPLVDAENLLAEAQGRAAEATEQLAFAKRNLAEVTAYTNAQTSVEATGNAFDSAAKAENAVATDALAASEQRESGVLRSTLSARMAATAEIRILEGNIQGSSRAAAAFLNMLPGVGAALQAAFTVFGAVALLEVIYQIGDAYVQMYEKAHKAGEEIAAQFNKQLDAINEQNASLDVENDKLQFQIDKLEGNPNNGLKTAIDESIEAADKLQKMLQSDNDELDRLLKQHSVSILQATLTGVAPTTFIAKDLTDASAQKDQAEAAATLAHNTAMQQIASVSAAAKTKEQIKAIHDVEMTETSAYFGALANIQQQYIDRVKTLNDQQLELQRANNARGHSILRNPLIGGAPPDIDYTPGVNLTGGELAAARTRLQTLQSEQQQSTLQARANADQAKKAAEEEAARAAAAHLAAIEEEFTRKEQQEIQIFGHGPTAGQAVAWWEPYLNEFDKQSKQYEHVLEQVNKYAVAQHKEIFEQALKANPSAAVHLANTPEERTTAISAASRAYEEMAREQERVEKGLVSLDKEIAKQSEDLLRSGDRWRSYNAALAESDDIAAENKANLADAHDAFGLLTGDIDQYQADIQAAARDTGLYNAKLQSLRDELAKLQAASKIVAGPLGQKQNIDPENAAAIQKVQNQIAQLMGKQNVENVQNATKAAQDIAKPYLDAFNSINRGWLKVQNDLIAGNKNIKQDFVQMGVALVQEAAKNVELMLAKFVQGEILKVAAKKAAEAENVTTAATSAAIQNTIAAQSLAVTLSKKAVEAASTSYAWASAWGGPIAGAIAAAAAFAGVESLAALAAFESGGIVSGGSGQAVPIVAHAGERVLSAPQTQNFERLVNQPAAASRPAFHLAYSPTINAYDKTGLRSMARAMSGDIIDIVREGLGKGTLTR